MTEYKKNDKGIWLPTNLNKRQSNPSKIPNITKTISNFTSHIPKITALFTVIGIIIGNLNIYNYLKHINFDFLFSDIIGNSSSAIAILLIHLLFLFLLTFGFFSPFLINIFAKVVSFDKNLEINYEKLYGVCLLNSIFYIIITVFYLKLNFQFEYYAFMIFLSSFIFRFDRFNFITPKDKSLFIAIFVANITVFPSFIYFSFVYFSILPTVEDNFITWTFFLVGTLLFLFNFLVSYISKTNTKYSEILVISSLIFIVIYNFFLSSFQDYSISLHKPKFIEKPKNSSWYIIHNGNTNSEKINGLSKTEIQNLKLEFKPLDKDVKDIESPNALYGYMAWNLGNTKVFCPVSVDFFDDKGNNKEKSAKCLVIDGKYLQPVSEHYLAK
ncbi:hypothetical protein LP123_00155 [Moraxella bovis]|uniref:Uncharacterized protein n=1 Tax=Moraxella bovis TaxID=476 RepID=A0AAQ2T2D3_MORBO|nr:hypothetical protein [Moraxella bovis]AWY21551.1 hypothetical protein DQF64_14265 [Moraxella bovis]OOR89492.1 hypothetical protein B0182_07115 [Moraxella bovis]UYZ75743.1 hypothetical protein LP093_13645 [Moraxella bovis]UYZ78316.1 hypothetical protein LP115_00155 [Moraxella bovis]UYZ81202.1 hypothetical protein LP113_00155 [Moraxella bovis]